MKTDSQQQHDLMEAGGFGLFRLREVSLGGVSHDLLEANPIRLVLVH